MKIKRKDAILFLGFFIVLFGYLQGSLTLVSNKVYYSLLLIAVLLIYSFGRKAESIYLDWKPLAAWACLSLPMLYKNREFSNGNYESAIRIFLLAFFLTVLIKDIEWVKISWDVIRLFVIFHFAVGLFFLANKGLLLSLIVPRFSLPEATYRTLINAINSGYMTGICNHYSTMGMYMALGVIAFSGVMYRKEKKKLTDIFILVAFLIGMAMTGKRGPLVFVVLSIVVVWFLFSGMKLTDKILARVVAAVVLGGILFVVAYIKIPQIRNIITRFFEGKNINDITNGRIEYFWINVLSMFRQNPLFGLGWRSFRSMAVGVFGRASANDAHNIYLQLLGENGIIGFLLVMTFFVSTLWYTYKSIKFISEKKLLSENTIILLQQSMAYQVFFLAYGMTGNTLYDGQCFYPYMLAATAGWSSYIWVKKYLKESSKNENERRESVESRDINVSCCD